MLRLQIRVALKTLMLRGLKKSANFCAELLQNLPAEPNDAGDAEAEKPERLSDVYLTAKAYFDLQEYERCAWVFGRSGPALISDRPLDFFLWAFATYLGGEKQKEEAIREGNAQASNEHLQMLIESLQAAKTCDAFSEWLLGVCLKEQGGATSNAKAALIRSVTLFPYHWSAWLDLFQLCPNIQVFQEVLASVPDSWPREFFHVHGLIELQNERDAIEMGILERNCDMFPRSPFTLGQKAMTYYGMTDYETAHELFDELSRLDPYRLTNVDAFSNLLFVKEARAELSHLAHQVFKIDKYRAESCCVVGNYYALKRQHDRAVTYFKRALRSNRNFHSALILLGHEFIELRNFPAALEVYRQAVEVNPSDYRAWYGLGQAYELNRMFYYSIHYYNKAKALKPYDPRIWCALGGSYENIDMNSLAIKCFERAEANEDKEGIAVIKLAKLFEKARDKHQAAKYYIKHLDRRRREGLILLRLPFLEENDSMLVEAAPCLPKQEDQDALKFLVMYFRDEVKLDDAQACAESLQMIVGSHDPESQALLKEIQSKKNAMYSKRPSGRS